MTDQTPEQLIHLLDQNAASLRNLAALLGGFHFDLRQNGLTREEATAMTLQYQSFLLAASMPRKEGPRFG